MTGEIIFDKNLPDGEEGNMQSAEWCFPVMVILAKYNKGTYDKYFRDIFAFCDKVRTTSINGWKPFRISEQQDMKSTQIVSDRGGAAKVKYNFCHLCYCTSTNLALQSQLPCQYCSAAGIPACLHHPVYDGDCITKAQREMGTLASNLDYRKLIKACKKAGNVTPDGKCDWGGFSDSLPLHLVSHGDTPSVYDRNPGGDKIRFRTNLNDTMKQLKLVKYTTKKYSPDEKQDIMVEAMRDVCRFKYCQDVINFGNQGKNAMGYLEDALPCILHLHKRDMKKLLRSSLSSLFIMSRSSQQQAEYVMQTLCQMF
jgi:hypothetical protein